MFCAGVVYALREFQDIKFEGLVDDHVALCLIHASAALDTRNDGHLRDLIKIVQNVINQALSNPNYYLEKIELCQI